MSDRPDSGTPGRRRSTPFPTRIFAGVIITVCAALGFSAFHSYRSMIEMRNLYLQDRAQEISSTLTERLRGPDRLDPRAWQVIMDEAIRSGSYPWLRYLALISENGQSLVSIGQPSAGLYVYEAPVRGPRWGRQGGRFGPGPQSQGGGPAVLRLRVGVARSSADFLAHQAYVHLAISALAILTLCVLAYLLARTFRNLLELQAQEESQRHLASLGRLAATLAHEIRNPLGAIKGLTQVAQERLPRDHDTQELMTTVVAEAERLERLVTDLLTFARPRAMAPAEVNLKVLLADVAQQLRSQADGPGIVFDLPDPNPPAVVFADPDGLRQVMLNVFLNAIEASPADSRIEVRIESAGEHHVLEVCDEGSGLGDQDPDELFQPFVTTKTRGTGLGLAVSRKIVERLGGTIELRRREPRGTICRIVLPACAAAPVEAEAGSSRG